MTLQTEKYKTSTPPDWHTPIALTIAGSDSGGGAGIQADLKTFSALGVYGASVITAITAQNTKAVTAVHNIPPEIIRAQMAAIFDDFEVNAVKIGMLSTPQIIDAVASGLEEYTGTIILDPVMVAKSGDRLLQSQAIETLRSRLLPVAELVTPNLPEAAVLLDCDVAQSEAEMVEQGNAILALGAQCVLMKGGHAHAQDCVDLLIRSDGETVRFSTRRQLTNNTHGTGCTLSSAIAAGIATGLALEESVGQAHRYLQMAISHADELQIGAGHGPVHHFHATW